jgi:hypothetical protein
MPVEVMEAVMAGITAMVNMLCGAAPGTRKVGTT